VEEDCQQQYRETNLRKQTIKQEEGTNDIVLYNIDD
jgi:hypothetical protein